METKAHIRPPTEKQLKFATAIAEALGIELPAEKTRQSLFLFIRDNRPEFDEKQKKPRCSWLDCLDREEDADMFWAMGGDPMTGGLADD